MPYKSPPNSPWKRIASVLARYSVAFVCVGLSLLLFVSWRQIGQATPFLMAVPIVAMVTWYAGLVPGLLTTLLLALVLAIFVIPPFDTFLDEKKDTRIAVFLLVAGLITAVLDAHRRAGEALRKSEERFRAVYEHAAVGLKQIALDGRLLEVNSKLCEILGYAREELLQRSVAQLVHPDDLALENRQLNALLVGEIPSYVLEKRYLRKSGEPVWVRVTSSLAGGPGAAGTYRITVVEDISERKRAQETQHFLLEASGALASSLDEATTLGHLARLAVPTMADWCAVDLVRENGTTESLAIAHHDPAKVHWARELQQRYPTDPTASRGVPQVLRTGRAEIYPEIPDALLVESAIDADHLAILRQVGFCSAMIVPLVAHGRTLGAITLIAAESGRRYGAEDLALAEDVARRAATAIDNARLYGEVQEADRQKEAFLAMLGHELRTPIGVIVNTVAVLQRRYSGDPVLERLRARIERQIARIARLIDDMQDVTRINRGIISLEREVMDLNRLIRQIAEDQRIGLEDAGLRLALNLPPHVVCVDGDATRLAQVIANLLNNAVKFTDPGGVVTITLVEEGDSVVVSVCDTGIGIEPELLPRMFESFTQAEDSLDRSRGGLGLGLALVKGLVELHGGEVRGSSQGHGRGAEFTFRIPRAGEGSHPPPPDKQVSKPTRESGVSAARDETETRAAKD